MSDRLIRARDERFADLDFRAYRSACKADHTRRLACPWYIDQGNVLESRRVDNSRFAVWSRQARRYAQWFAAERLGLDARVTGVHQTREGRVWVMLDRGAPIELPEHVHPNFKQPGVAEVMS